jgi:hypothetical protein
LRLFNGIFTPIPTLKPDGMLPMMKSSAIASAKKKKVTPLKIKEHKSGKSELVPKSIQIIGIGVSAGFLMSLSIQ